MYFALLQLPYIPCTLRKKYVWGIVYTFYLNEIWTRSFTKVWFFYIRKAIPWNIQRICTYRRVDYMEIQTHFLQFNQCRCKYQKESWFQKLYPRNLQCSVVWSSIVALGCKRKSEYGGKEWKGLVLNKIFV